MRAPTLLLACSIVLVACRTTPKPHERALLNNELCAQQLLAGDPVQAEVYCDLGLEYSPDYAELWVNKGMAALVQGLRDEARRSFVKALQLDPENVAANQNLGLLHLEDGKYGKAHDQFQRVVELQPEHFEGRYNLALTFMKMNRNADARRELNALARANPRIADVHHSLGILDFGDKEFARAAEHIGKAAQLDPKVPAYWNDLGVTLMELSRFAEAEEAFSNCVRLETTNAICQKNQSIAARKAKLTDEAMKELEDVSEPQSAPALYMKARQLRASGLVEEEERSYEECLRLDPKFAPCHYGLFEIHSDNGREPAAQLACKNFLKYASQEEFPTEYVRCEKYLSPGSF